MVNAREEKLRPMIQAALDEGGVDAVVSRVCMIMDEFEARITELERRLNQNSSNSHKPPSSDGLKRPKRDNSLRSKNSGRKPGGQPGHTGQTLHASDTPDVTIEQALQVCPECGGDLTEEPIHSHEKRQIFELPDIKMLITEFLAQRKQCPRCGVLVTAVFPCEAKAPVQYGSGMQSVMAYLNVRHAIPCERVAEVCQDLFQHRPSAGSVVQAVVRCAEQIEPKVEEIRDALSKENVLHADETGVRCQGKTQWIHVACSALNSYFSYSPKRGMEGMETAGILPNYRGTLMHDFWKSYDRFECQHSRCGAHLLRELKPFAEEKQQWANKLIEVLIEMKKAAEDAREKNQESVEEEVRKRLAANYDRWIEAGMELHPEAKKPDKQRGRSKQSKERNLLMRMREKREEVLRYFHEIDKPFDNNQAERDLRMIKVQQKVSGCFRSEKGAERFCTISSYISTVRKHGKNVIDAIKAAWVDKNDAVTT